LWRLLSAKLRSAARRASAAMKVADKSLSHVKSERTRKLDQVFDRNGRCLAVRARRAFRASPTNPLRRGSFGGPCGKFGAAMRALVGKMR
jgi:hypothetical protein